MFREIELLTTEECERACRSVRALRKFWVQQHPVMTTYTLGASIGNSYSYQKYKPEVERYNPMLKAHFSWLYEILAQRMSEEFGEPFVLTEHFGLPGFVLYVAPPNLPPTIPPVHPPIHRDLQFRNLPWDHFHKDVDLGRAMSSTATLKLPKAGSGLEWWYLSPEDCIAKGLGDDPDPDAIAANTEMHFHEYTVGKMCVLPNVMPHRAALREFEGGDERITLQVHYVFADGAWQMYL